MEYCSIYIQENQPTLKINKNNNWFLKKKIKKIAFSPKNHILLDFHLISYYNIFLESPKLVDYDYKNLKQNFLHEIFENIKISSSFS